MKTQSTAHCVSSKFADFEEFAEAIREWDLDFRQLDTGNSPAELTQLACGDVLLTHADFNRIYHQRGGTPTNMRTFAFFDSEVKRLEWCGHDVVVNNTLCMFDNSGSFEAVTQPDFKVFTISLPEEKLVQIAQRLGLHDPHEIFKSSETVMQLPSSIACELYALMKQLKQAGVSGQEYLETDGFENDLDNTMPCLLVEAIARNYNSSTRPLLSNRKTALKKANEYIDASLCSNINMDELCDASDTSQRTLEYAFKEQYGLTPKRYILYARLNQVNKELLRANPKETTITMIAGKYGFWHMGQFSRDYRRLFGVNPSESLRTVLS